MGQIQIQIQFSRVDDTVVLRVDAGVTAGGQVRVGAAQSGAPAKPSPVAVDVVGHRRSGVVQLL
ncbi:hypothetical protein [Micromonospora olivasterospora]|uniref:hypothetical protein n=1 Tax=Micromonospora olivasterospora TaxID=1880 RepID=UPI0031DEB242